MRPTLFRLASDTEDNDEALGEHSVNILSFRRKCLTLLTALKQDRRREKSSFGLVPAEILQANDSLTHVINLYKQQVKGEIVNGNGNRPKQSGG